MCALTFAAGQAAHVRGWWDPEVVDVADMPAQTPAGGPLIVTAAAAQVGDTTTRFLATLAGAGRSVLLVTDGPLPDAVAAWLPPEGLHLVAGPEGDVKGVDPELLLAAGRIAGRRGWPDALVTDVAGLADIGPSGPPLVLPAHGSG